MVELIVADGVSHRISKLYVGDCRRVMNTKPLESIDAIITDPPYELGFMGKAWDKTGVAFDVKTWQAAYRVLKPGGHLLAFGGTRTFHRIACAIEDAGFEIRDSLAWLYGSGFPKSLDVSKALDKMAGAEREVIGEHPNPAGNKVGGNSLMMSVTGMPEISFITAPATDLAKQWDGWGTALKPAFEPVIVARKPFKGTVAKNVTAYGTGALNIDGCRIDGTKRHPGNYHDDGNVGGGRTTNTYAGSDRSEFDASLGRWPANVMLDEWTAYLLDAQADPANPSRFFYCAKASKRERSAGLPDGVINTHPTVKPVDVMRWLIRLVTPPGGLILDPFAGSGTTGVAAREEGFDFILIENEAASADIARLRLAIPTEVSA